MIVELLTSLLSFVPQGATPATERAIGVDENGWPIFAPTDKPVAPTGTAAAEGARPNSKPITPPEAAPPDVTPIGHPHITEPAVDPDASKRAEHAQPLSLTSPLRDVFARIGQPADLQDLRGIIAWYRVVLRDHRGGQLATREITHEADVALPDRDRLLLPGRKIYGREGGAVYAELHRLPMPSYEAEAAEELGLFGLLLRMPWIFADESQFEVHPSTFETVGRKRLIRVDVERITGAVRDPISGREVFDHFRLYCDPDTKDPVELRYKLATTRAERRILLSMYQRIGAVRVPMRRVIVDDVGNPAVEWSILRIDSGQRLSRTQFRPVSR